MTDLFESMQEHHAERLAIISRRDFYRSGISKAVNLQANSAGGYTWKYAQ